MEVQIDQLLPSDCDLVVVDADSRSCDERAAVQKVQRIAQQILRAAPTLVFKKVDSVLRGFVAAELRAMEQILGAGRVLLVNANPRKGRCVQDGNLRIDDRPLQETSFAVDPEHPRSSSKIVELLDAAAQDVTIVSPGDSLPAAGIIVGNASCTEDLWMLATAGMIDSTSSPACTGTLLAGGGEFFEAVLTFLLEKQRESCSTGEQETLFEPLTIQRDSLLVGGSSIGTIAAWQRGAIAIQRELETAEIARRVCCQIKQRGCCVLRNADALPIVAAERRHADAQIAKLIEVTIAVLASCRLEHLWIEGGRTASSLIRASLWQRLKPVAVHGDGVVRLMVMGEPAPSIVLKPGSYPWPIAASINGPATETTV